MTRVVIAFLTSVLLSALTGAAAIPLLRRLKAGQVVLGYVEAHKSKSGTPTMGGLFFYFSAAAVYLLLAGGRGRIAGMCLAIGAAYLAVGFLDDFVKIRYDRNLGLRPYQKIAFQIAIALLGGAFALRLGLTSVYLPFSGERIDLGGWFVPFAAFVFLAATNCVNLTDGLDGLAGGTSLLYFVFIGIYLCFSGRLCQAMYLTNSENYRLILLSACFVGALSGFLLYNFSKASVFMGDTGSLALGGVIAALSLYSGFALFLPILGITYVLSGISVILQVLHFKRTGRRLFLMAPLHHHFQMKGHAESKICFAYGLATALAGALLLLTFV